MSDEKQEPLTGHSYDGIHEFDNPLPKWWLLTFYGTIIFAAVYWFYYQFGGAPTQIAELEDQMTQLQVLQQANKSSAPGTVAGELEKQLNDQAVVARGLGVFQGKCAPCHGNDLQGAIGPNLVDDFWIHGKGALAEIVSVVRSGIPEKGMPPWENMLSADELSAVVVFIGSRQGTNPPNAKAPQGEKVVSD